MFEYWTDEFASSLRRVVDPPQRVLVDLGTAIPTYAPLRRDSVQMRVKAAGLNTSETVPGLLYAWARTRDGAWLALVSFAVPTANNAGRIETRQWCPARALTRVE
ncbi:hypothetical protein GCM10023319_63310 [Nocardia iowensis]